MQVCKITATAPKTVTKEFWLDGFGKLQKRTTAQVATGLMEVLTVQDSAAFADLLDGLTTDQCLTYGVPPRNAKLVSEKHWAELGKPDDVLPRSKSVFRWPAGGGVLMLDYDAPKDGSQAFSKSDLLDTLREAIPTLDASGFIWWPSTSSCIYHGDTELTGIKGQRVYVPIQDATDIERAGKALNARLWALGYGRCEVSKSGSILERGLFDSSVWQSNRIDFAAGAKCGADLEQRRGKPEVFEGFAGDLMDSRQAIPDPSPWEMAQADARKKSAREAVAPVSDTQRQVWMTERVDELVNQHGIARETARGIASRAVEKRDLMGDWRLTLKSETGERITATVLQVLDDPARYHGMLTLDPLEPDYDGGRWVGKLFLFSARPNLFSMAHGGVSFRLSRQPARVEVVGGKAREVADALLDVLRRAPDVFDFGAELVTVKPGGAISPMNEHALRYEAGGLTQFWKWHKMPNGDSVEQLLDPPATICKSVLSLGAHRGLKPLEAVITAPTLRPDGSVLATPGYDPATRLLYECAGTAPTVPERPTDSQARAALDALWKPFSTFPFCGSLDHAVHLAALLTTAVRAILPTAPAFAYDAPVQGSGKTLLARCVGILATGEEPGVWPHTAGRDDEEARKRIFTLLRSGSRAVVWDNVVGSFDSAAMASAVTSPSFTDRILGASASSSVPNKMMLLLTGNNLTLAGEMPRRVLVCRIDPATDKPFAREFTLDPAEYCIENRQEMIGAALTLIRARLTNHPSPLAGGRLASFESWDAWVRQAVLYADQLQPGQFGDVMGVIQANQATDPEQETLGQMLQSWQQIFGSTPVSARDVLTRINAGLSYADHDRAESRLQEALEEFSRGKLSARSVGRCLQYRKDRLVDGLRLAGKPDRNGVFQWWVKAVA
jgi:hypothetical protein